MAELPNGDFAHTTVRQFLFASRGLLAWEALAASADAELAAIAAKAVKELTYHMRHSGEWMVRLGDGTEESHALAQAALDALWPYTGEMFEADGLDAEIVAAGIGFDPALVAPGGFTEETAAAPAHALLSAANRPTAVFAANDLSAIQVIRTAGELGLSVPADLSVVGFDNIPESAHTDPPLTTVDQSIQMLGQEAVRILIELIERPGADGAPAHVTLPTELVVRRSTAAADSTPADPRTADTTTAGTG
jgi:hypothetical protein